MADEFQNATNTMVMELTQSITALSSKIDVVGIGIEGIKNDIDGMADDISMIKEAMYGLL